MTENNETQPTRLYFTGDCDGLADLREALSGHPDLEVVGWSDHFVQAAGVLAGGHLDCVLHGTRSESFPATEIAAIVRPTPLIAWIARYPRWWRRCAWMSSSSMSTSRS